LGRGKKVTPDDGDMASVAPSAPFKRTLSAAKHSIERRGSYLFLSIAFADNVILIFFQGLLLTDDIVLETAVIKFSSSIALGLAALDFVFRCLSFERFTDVWNRIDLVVMLLSVPELVFLWTGQLEFMKPAFLFFRACRPLRLILRSESLRDFAKQIKALVKPFLNMFVIVFFLFCGIGYFWC